MSIAKTIARDARQLTAALHDLEQHNENRQLDALYEAVCALALLAERIALEMSTKP